VPLVELCLTEVFVILREDWHRTWWQL